MLVTVAIYASLIIFMLVTWYAAFSHYNRRHSRKILRWIDAAFAGHGKVAGVHWLAPARFHAQLQLAPNASFQQASIDVRLSPRQMPVRWLLAWMRREPEVMTFEADLEFTPGYDLEVHNHRWCGRTRRSLPTDGEGWETERCTPFMITTKKEWQREIATMMNTLVVSRERDLLNVTYHRTSPHFTACIPIEALAPGSGTNGQLFAVLRELAGGASASRF
jgi:hypothetical protein